MKNFLYWFVGAFVAGVVGVIVLILAVAILRVAWDALTCPNNIFERDTHPRWQSEGK